jgi:hypothetical protein
VHPTSAAATSDAAAALFALNESMAPAALLSGLLEALPRAPAPVVHVVAETIVSVVLAVSASSSSSLSYSPAPPPAAQHPLALALRARPDVAPRLIRRWLSQRCCSAAPCRVRSQLSRQLSLRQCTRAAQMPGHAWLPACCALRASPQQPRLM